MDHTSCRLRLAAIADAPAILEIYAQYMDTPITFETELPSLEEFEGRIRAITAEYPWIVCEDETGRIIGYAYGHKQLERAAYRISGQSGDVEGHRQTDASGAFRAFKGTGRPHSLQSGDKSECEERCDA